MKIILWVSFWFCVQTILAIEYVVYEGLRVDMSAVTLNRDILRSIVPVMNRTMNHTFKDLTQSGTFGSHLTLTHIKITKPKIIEDRFDITKYTFVNPIYTLHGSDQCIMFDLTFNYYMTWLGIPLASGKGVGVVTNLANKIMVFFNESDPDVQIPHPWDIMNVTLPWGLFLRAELVDYSKSKHN